MTLGLSYRTILRRQHHARAKLATSHANASSLPTQACGSSAVVGSQWPAPASPQGWHHQAVVACLAVGSALPLEDAHSTDSPMQGCQELHKWQEAARAPNAVLYPANHAQSLPKHAGTIYTQSKACSVDPQQPTATLAHWLQLSEQQHAAEELRSRVSQLQPTQAASLLLDLAYYARLEKTDSQQPANFAEPTAPPSSTQKAIQQLCCHLLQRVHTPQQNNATDASRQEECSLRVEKLVVLTWACGVLYTYLAHQPTVHKEGGRRRVWHHSKRSVAAAQQAGSTNSSVILEQQAVVLQHLQSCAAWAAQQLHPALLSVAARPPSYNQQQAQHQPSRSQMHRTQQRHDTNQAEDAPSCRQAALQLQPSSLTRVLWGLAQVQMRPSPRWLSTFFAASSALLQGTSSSPDSKQGHVGNYRSSTPHEQYSSQHLSLTLWALAKLQLRPPPAYIKLVLDEFQQHMVTASQQSLANTMWAAGRLRVAPSKQFVTAWCACMKDSIQDSRNGLLQGQQHGETERAPAAHGASSAASGPNIGHAIYHPNAWDDSSTYNAAQEQHHISQALWGFARLSRHVKPCQAWLGGLLAESAPGLAHASAQSLSNLVWALGELGHSPSAAWLSSFYTASLARLPDMSPQGVCNILQGLMQVRAAVSQTWAHHLQQQAVMSIKRYNAAQLSQLMWCLSQLEVTLQPELTKAALQAMSNHMCWYGGAHPEGRLSTWSRNTWPVMTHHEHLPSFRVRKHAGHHTRVLHAEAAGRTSLAVQPPTAGQITSLPSQQRNVAAFALGPPGNRTAGQEAMQQTESGRHPTATAGLLPRPVSKANRNLLQRIVSRKRSLASASSNLQLRLLRSAAKRTQQARMQARQKEQLRLCNLAPDSLARLLYALAKGMQEAQLPPMRPYWRAACVIALRMALPRMDALSLSQALPAALSLGVRPPLPPTRRALHRVTRDANHLAMHGGANRLTAHHDANHLVCLLASLAPNKQVANDRWTLDCMQTLQQHIPHLSSGATLQLAKALPVLHARMPGQLQQDDSEARSVGCSEKPQQQVQKTQQQWVRQQHMSAAWGRAVSDLSHALLARSILHVSGLELEDMQRLVASLASLPVYLPPYPVLQSTEQQQAAAGAGAGAGLGAGGTPLEHFLHAVQPRLPHLPSLQLVYLLSSIAGAGCGRPPASFLAAAETASQVMLMVPGLGGVDKVQLLSTLRHLGHIPSPDWVATWYSHTTRQLGKLGPQHLHKAIQHAQELAKVDPQLAPPRVWLQAAAYASNVMPKAASWALNKQLSLNSGTAVVGSEATDAAMELTVQEVQLLGATAGHLLCIFSRLQALQVPVQDSNVHAQLQSHCQALATAAQSNSALPSIAVLHALHEARMLQPASTPPYVQSAASPLAHALTQSHPRELFRQIWEHAATTTPSTASARDTTAADKQPGHSRQGTQGAASAASQSSAGPPVAALTAAHRAVEMLAHLVRWGAQPSPTWLHDVLGQILARAKCFQGPQASALLRTLALLPNTSTSVQPTIVQQLLDAFLPAMRAQCSHAQLAEVGWAISVLQAEPSTRWWLAYEAEMLLRMSELGSEELCEIMWAFGSLRHRPAKPWMEAWARALLPQLPRCKPDQLARLVWALAAVQQVPSEVLMQRYLLTSGQALRTPGAFCAQSLSLMIGGLASLGAHPRPEWLTVFAAHFCSLLPQCRGVHLVKILGSLAAMAYKPPEDMLRSVVSVIAGRVSELDAGAAAQLTWAMGRLDTSNGQKYLQAVTQIVQQGRTAAPTATQQVAGKATARAMSTAVASRRSVTRSHSLARSRHDSITEQSTEAEAAQPCDKEGTAETGTDTATDEAVMGAGAASPVRRRKLVVGRVGQLGRSKIARRARSGEN